MAFAAALSSSVGDGGVTMDFLFSEPLLDAALAQIKSMDQFEKLEENFRVAEESGKTVPHEIKAKLSDKRKKLHGNLVHEKADAYLEESGLGKLVEAKKKWVDVHFMAEAHGVGSSIPMVSYSGLSQEDLQTGMNAFYAYLAQHKEDVEDAQLKEDVCKTIFKAYKDLYDGATGEFGGYVPFESMVEHPPEKVKEIVMS